MKTHDYETYAAEYATIGMKGTQYLAFRDIPEVIQQRVHGRRALDYGCGPGRSTRFLRSLGFDAAGVDISPSMLEQAVREDPSGDYRRIESAHIPFESGAFDLVLSSFVFLEVPSLEGIETILREMNRVLSETGTIIIVTSPTDCYSGNWVSLSYDFPENARDFKSGDTVKLLFKGTGVVLYDFYWTDSDYRQAFSNAGLKVTQVLRPRGRADEHIEWLDERKKSPVLIFVLSKRKRPSKSSMPASGKADE